MKIISKESGLAAIKVVPDEVKPLGGYYIPELVKEISTRYQLAQVPTVEDVSKSGAVFHVGQFSGINIRQFGFFNDSLSVITQDTADAEIVLLDAVAWLKDKFGLREPVTKPQRGYLSELVVEFANGYEKRLGQFSSLWELMQTEFEAVTGVRKTAMLNRLDFASDPQDQPASGNMVFLIERRAQAPYSLNRYFTRAYLPTAAHVRVLELMDKILGD